MWIFQSTHPLRGATIKSFAQALYLVISIHAPLAGCDQRRKNCMNPRIAFQSTHPLRGATPLPFRNDLKTFKFQSTHPLRGATWICQRARAARRGFQSTHPLRGATTARLHQHAYHCYFNPRTPCGVRRAGNVAARRGHGISIHAPLAGCDVVSSNIHRTVCPFQSTHPLRGATSFSISSLSKSPNFNPRTPCGVRQQKRTKKMRHFCAKGINTSFLCAKNAHPAT